MAGKKKKRKPKCEYALYKGEVLITVGTAVEIEEEMGWKHQRVWNLAKPYYKNKQCGKNAYVVYKIESEEEK